MRDASRRSAVALEPHDIRVLQPNPGRDLGRDRFARVVHRARSCGTRVRRAGAQSPHLADLWLDRHGDRDLEHALRRHARLSDVDPDQVRYSAGSHLRADRDRRRFPGDVHGEPKRASPSPSDRVEHHDGRGDLGDALHRNGGDAHAGDAQLRPRPVPHLDRDSGHRIVCRPLDCLSIPLRRLPATGGGARAPSSWASRLRGCTTPG